MQISGVTFEGGWETISSETHYSDAHLTVTTERVRTPRHPDGKSWTVVHRKSAVVVAPITSDGRLVLIRQERIAIEAAIWEVPAGQVDSTGDLHLADLQAVALRELREETGYELPAGGELLPLGDFFSSPGFTDEHAYFFLAADVEPGRSPPEQEPSVIDCRAFTFHEIASMIVTNEIRDANTLSICAKLVAHGVIDLRD